ncbi:hypothetical protein [Rhodanobacter caeni]|uniref:hypothetical protein n=1 Tax=Rhodanobacter caeni TaxID=657654 RepID=UPI0031DCAF95
MSGAMTFPAAQIRLFQLVIPAKAGIQRLPPSGAEALDPGFRRDDEPQRKEPQR